MKLEIAQLLNESNIKYNKFYMNRYIKFLEAFGNCNDEVVHKHHILPRSMFPEYINFKDNEWNCATLSPRAHFIAHYLLWKIFRNYETAHAFRMMSRITNIKRSNNREFQRAVELSLATERNKIWINNGKESKTVQRNDFDAGLYPGYVEGNLNMKGRTWIHNNEGKVIRVFEDELQDYLDNGWIHGGINRANTGKVKINNGIDSIYIDPEELDMFIEDGWNEGGMEREFIEKWMFKDGVELKVKSEDLERMESEGWEYGRIHKQTPPNHKGLIWVNKEGKNKKVSENELENYLNNGWIKGYPKGVHDKTDNRKLKARDQYNKNPKKWYCYYKLCTIRDEYNIGFKSLKTVLRIALQTEDFNINDFDVFNSKEVYKEALDEWLSAYEPSEEALNFETVVDSVISFLKENWDTNIDIRRLVRWFGIDAWKIADVLYDEYMETGKAYREGMYLNDMRKSFRAGWNPHHCPTYKFYKKFCLDM